MWEDCTQDLSHFLSFSVLCSFYLHVQFKWLYWYISIGNAKQNNLEVSMIEFCLSLSLSLSLSLPPSHSLSHSMFLSISLPHSLSLSLLPGRSPSWCGISRRIAMVTGDSRASQTVCLNVPKFSSSSVLLLLLLSPPPSCLPRPHSSPPFLLHPLYLLTRPISYPPQI